MKRGAGQGDTILSRAGQDDSLAYAFGRLLREPLSIPYCLLHIYAVGAYVVALLCHPYHIAFLALEALSLFAACCSFIPTSPHRVISSFPPSLPPSVRSSCVIIFNNMCPSKTRCTCRLHTRHTWYEVRQAQIVFWVCYSLSAFLSNQTCFKVHSVLLTDQ